MYRRFAHAFAYAKLLGCWLLAAVGLAAAEEIGKRWDFIVGGAISSSAAMSPDGKTIYVGVETPSGFGRVVAIDLADPTRAKWQFPAVLGATGAFISSPAVASDGTVYIGSEDGKLYALNGQTGAKLWERDTGLGSIGKFAGSPALGADGTIYFGAGDSRLRAVSPANELLWVFDKPGNYIDSSPAIGPDGTIYVGSYDRKLYAVTPQGGEKWNFPTSGEIKSSPAIGPDGTIYVGSFDQNLYAIAPDGTKKWDLFVGDKVFSSPVVGADGTIYLGVSPNFYAVNPDGTKNWVTNIGSSTQSTAAIRGDGVIVVGADDRKVHFLNPDGTQRPSFDNGVDGDDFEASPLIGSDGTIYIGSLQSNRLYALNGNGSRLSSYSSWPAFRRDVTHTGRAFAMGTGQLLDISARVPVAGTSTLFVGLTIAGASDNAKSYLLRGVGPALAQFGVSNPMPDPQLEVFFGNVSLGLKNDNWGELLLPGASIVPALPSDLVETTKAVGAFPLPVGSKDAALIAPLRPGSYTAQVTSVDQQGGVAVVEAYDVRSAGDPTSRIVNLSTRSQAGTGDNVLIAGFVVGGTGTVRLLIRAVGPGLTQFGVSGALARPTMTVFSGSKTVGSNNGWESDGFKYDLIAAMRRAGAFPLKDGSLDCALILNATAGDYTVLVSGANGTTGEALVEIYVLP